MLDINSVYDHEKPISMVSIPAGTVVIVTAVDKMIHQLSYE